MDSEFIVEYVADVSEKYPRVEITKRSKGFAFLDVSALEDKTIVVNVWTERGGVQLELEFLKSFLNDSEEYLKKSFDNVDNAKFDDD